MSSVMNDKRFPCREFTFFETGSVRVTLASVTADVKDKATMKHVKHHFMY